MQTVVNLWPLMGVFVIVIGFVLRFNPLLVVSVAGVITGLAAHFPLEKIISEMGSGFCKPGRCNSFCCYPWPSSACWSATACVFTHRTGSPVFNGPPSGGC